MIDKNECCGCSACAVTCPRDALTMTFDAEGYYKPVLDVKKCVECGLCEKVCPSIHSKLLPITKERTYLAVAKDRKILAKSSSGGVGYLLARQALREGYTVCGVAYDAKDNVAKHVIIEHEEDLPEIQGSKYLKSSNQTAFQEIVKRDKAIVFGTPCEIAGLDRMLRLRGKRTQFILVDIFCHGVPSQLIWQQHVKWLKSKKKIADTEGTSFRQGKYYLLKINKYKAWYNEDAFYTFFLQGWLKNRKCCSCDFRRTSAADLRIGDCLYPKYERSTTFSPSCILANTECGTAFLTKCQAELEIRHEDYKVIDEVQEKENTPVAPEYDTYMKRLQAGEYPQDIIAHIMAKGKIKSFVKNKIIRLIASKREKNTLPL